jgi:phosphomannomutase
MAKLAAQILAANNFNVKLSSQFCPTPCVSWLVKKEQALCGVLITASHNPAEWNGVKFKESAGSAASPEYTNEIEARVRQNEQNEKQYAYPDFDELVKEGRIATFDPHETYLHHLTKFIDTDAIARSGFTIAVDPLFGAGTDFIKLALPQNQVIQIHGEKDPNFGGINPEPIEKNLSLLKKTVVEKKAAIGLATDGDADRIGAFTAEGEFVNSHQIFALLLKHYVTNRKLKGVIVKSLSTTQLINEMCEKYKLELIETPIGFKYISKELLEKDALMGGEESGGISLREHVHERDGVLNGLMLLEMMAVNGKSLQGLLDEIYAEFGRYYFARDDYHISLEKIAEIKNRLKDEKIEKVGSVKVAGVNNADGTKLLFDDRSWLLVRASGTEPLLRVYAEAKSQERVKELLGFAKTHFGI